MSRNSRVVTVDGTREGDHYFMTFTRISSNHKWITKRAYSVGKRRFNHYSEIVRQVGESDRRYTLLEPKTFEWN